MDAPNSATQRLKRAAARLRRWSDERRGERILRELRGTLDWEEFERLRAEFSADHDDPLGPQKYFDADVYLARDVKRAIACRLHRSPGRRVLDLGCGFGYFLYVCSWLGHEAVGVDFVAGNRPDASCYGPMVEFFGQRRILHEIVRFTPLPDLDGPFDLVTAHAICFSCHASDEVWEVPEWDFFLKDLARHLKPEGVLHFEFNTRPDGKVHSPLLEKYFRDLGAEVRGHGVRLASARLLPR